MTDNCEWCGKFITEDRLRFASDYLCRKCDDKLKGEHNEVETGIGNGQFMDQPDEDCCRHYIKK